MGEHNRTYWIFKKYHYQEPIVLLETFVDVARFQGICHRAANWRYVGETRFGVLWRKCSQGNSSDKGNRWVERILTLRQTCRLRSLKTYPILVGAVQRYFNGQEPDLSWVTQY